MATNRYDWYMIVLSIAVMILQNVKTLRGAKPGDLKTLCGKDFTHAWQDCCDKGYPACDPNHNDTRTVEVLQQKRAAKLILPSRVAKSFLETIRKRGIANAVEECCNEGCTYKEVSEYQCF